MKHILSIAAVIFSSISYAQEGWEKTMVTPGVSVSFPAKPAQTEIAKGQQSFIFKQPDSTANYMVAVSDLQLLAGLDAATLEAAMEKDETWEQAKTAFITSMGEGAGLVKDEMITIQNTRALKLVVNRKNGKGEINVLTVVIFVKDANSVNVIFNSRNGKGAEKNKDQFLNSIEIK
jgi:hypothetical protein